MKQLSIYILGFFLLFAAKSLSAQQFLPSGKANELPLLAPEHFAPCASPSGKLRSTQRFQQRLKREGGLPSNWAEQKNAPRYLPISLHIVGRDDSTGFGDLNTILNSFCQLNSDFSQTGIQFFIEFPIHYHANSSWFRHDSTIAGGLMMLQENIPNTINVYFVQNPAGACGYNLPYAGVAMNYSCLSGHTFAHELGHNLGLPHTFLGWEGGVSWDNSIAPDFSQPAPDTVTYNYTNFKDTMYTDTLIIDTALVELVARSNCYDAADGFCDTEADYLAYRWVCNSQGQSTVTQRDPTGASFTSPGSPIMSYSSDNCQDAFTPEQEAAMLNHSDTRRPGLLGRMANLDTIRQSDIQVLEPLDNSEVYQERIQFRWQAVPGATHYYLEVNYNMGSDNMERLILTDTFYQSAFTYTPRNPLLAYTWRIKAFNDYRVCGNLSQTRNFNTTTQPPVSLRNEELLNAWTIRVYPQPLPEGQNLRIDWQSRSEERAEYLLYNQLGQIVLQGQLQLYQGQQFLELPNIGSGIYSLQLRSQARNYVQQLIVR